ncbi:MAG: hypothetical protein ACOCQR_00395 [bacterium]
MQVTITIVKSSGQGSQIETYVEKVADVIADNVDAEKIYISLKDNEIPKKEVINLFEELRSVSKLTTDNVFIVDRNVSVFKNKESKSVKKYSYPEFDTMSNLFKILYDRSIKTINMEENFEGYYMQRVEVITKLPQDNLFQNDPRIYTYIVTSEKGHFIEHGYLRFEEDLDIEKVDKITAMMQIVLNGFKKISIEDINDFNKIFDLNTWKCKTCLQKLPTYLDLVWHEITAHNMLDPKKRK